jgi:hypothetical protein
MPTVDFTLEDITRVIDERLERRLDERFLAEREYTKNFVYKTVNEAVQKGMDHVTAQFQSFIDDNFNPAMEAIDERFNHLEDRVDRLAVDTANLRIDMRHVKQALRTHGLLLSTDARP